MARSRAGGARAPRSGTNSGGAMKPRSKRAKNSKQMRNKHVLVMVLGDVGRSPRMQYHALSLARLDANLRVSLVGHEGEHCIPELYEQPNVDFLLFAPWLQRLPRKFFVLLAPFKVVLQVFQLFWLLLVTAGAFDLVLLQNPPTIPTFVVVWLCCRLKGAKFVIDWHNLGFSILSLSLGERHWLVTVAKWIEKTFGRRADANLCVTKAMQQWLHDAWQIRATVLYDKPPMFFKPTLVEEQHELFQRIDDQLAHCHDLVQWNDKLSPLDETLVTRRVQSFGRGKKTLLPRENRPAILISSTSWTPDEDFGILLNALIHVDQQTATSPAFPNLLVLVTGKGPQKEMYLERIQKLQLKRIRIATMWLEAKDYPLVLGSADLGVCLHTSSSGLDLPMKVLDMFGCGVPVCAVDFACLSELVQHDSNGLVFTSSEQLAAQIIALLTGFPHTLTLSRFRRQLANVQHWPQTWNHVAAPLLLELLTKKHQ